MSVTAFIRVDVGSEAHVVAAVDARGDVTLRPTRCTEDADGYARLDAALAAAGTPEATLVVCEATGHYWQNLVAHLWAGGWRVAVANPLRTARYGRP